MSTSNKDFVMHKVWQPDIGNGKYQNPIIHADYSDPDIIRVGEDYYMVSSSFHMSPCLPVLHSKDLVNWQIINYVAEKLPFSHYDEPRHGEGVWAPSIRYYAGKFWVFFSTPDEGIFMSTAEDPAGQWSPLHLVKRVKGWIDPCPFWDDDGKAYLVNAFAKSRIGFKSILHISRMKPDGTELLDEGVHIFDGNENHETIEGPKMYKRGEYYYIFAPAGGVATGWQTVLRSKNIYGPYEDKIVLHQGNTTINGPHQGGWVEDTKGESWFIHFQDKGPYGRIVHMQPMRWESNWPVMGDVPNGEQVGQPVLEWTKPHTNSAQDLSVPATSDDFSSTSLGLQWQWQANMKKAWYQLNDNKLRLFSFHTQSESLYKVPNILTQKFPAETFTATTKVTLHLEEHSDKAGIVILGKDYASISISKDGESYKVTYIIGNENGMEQTKAETFIDRNEMLLRLDVEPGAKCLLSYSTDGESFVTLDEEFQAIEGRWVGAQMGIFCYNKHNESSGYADFDYFIVEGNSEKK